MQLKTNEAVLGTFGVLVCIIDDLAAVHPVFDSITFGADSHAVPVIGFVALVDALFIGENAQG